LLAGSARSRATYLFCRKFATVVACTCSYQRSNLKADWRTPRVSAALFVNRRRRARRALRRPLPGSIEQWPQVARASRVARTDRHVVRRRQAPSRAPSAADAAPASGVGAELPQRECQAAHALIAAISGAGTS
jgi:hypothetical protein